MNSKVLSHFKWGYMFGCKAKGETFWNEKIIIKWQSQKGNLKPKQSYH